MELEIQQKYCKIFLFYRNNKNDKYGIAELIVLLMPVMKRSKKQTGV